MLVVFDIDGTIANIDHRLDYVRTKPKNWSAVKAGISNDAVNPHVAATFFALDDAGHDVIFATGRSEDTRDATVAWLDANGFWRPSRHLYMRKSGDHRSDVIVKREIFHQITRAWGRKPDMAFEDRPRVVRMLREEGFFVFNVYQAEEDF